MRIPAIFLVLLLSVQAAMAQTRTVIAGKPFKLHFAYATNPDCSSVGEVVIRVTSPPGNGSIAVGRGDVFPNFPASNTARRGYTGPDSVSLEVIYPSGQQQQASYHLMVSLKSNKITQEGVEPCPVKPGTSRY